MQKTLLGIAILSSLSTMAFAEPVDDGGEMKAPTDGFRSNVTLGVARFPSAPMDLGTGVSASVLVGKEWVSGQLGLQAGLELEAQSFGHVLSSDGDLNTYSVRPTVRLSYYAGHWMPYAELGIGYTYASAADSSDNMLALEGAAGLSYRFTDRLALGAYVRYEPDLEPALNQFVDFGLAFSVLH